MKVEGCAWGDVLILSSTETHLAALVSDGMIAIMGQYIVCLTLGGIYYFPKVEEMRLGLSQSGLWGLTGGLESESGRLMNSSRVLLLYLP